MYPDVRTGSKVGAAVVGAISVAAMTAATLVGQYSMTVNKDASRMLRTSRRTGS